MVRTDKIWHLVFVVLAGCSQANFAKLPDPATTTGGPAVCDPFGGNPSTAQNGLAGNLYYLNDSQPLYGKVNDYFTNGHKANATLFLGELNVPTRLFSQGFAAKGGGYLTREDGSILMEKFALSLKSTLRLAPDDADGYRQFAVLSDDGSVMTINQNGTVKELINNDNIQNTTMGCGNTEAIYFDHNTSLPMRMDYFQGPRYHIALILMWRVVGGQVPPGDQYCGTGTNDTWFDYNNGSQPKQAYYDLLARGWRPLRSINYWLDQNNPCSL